MMRRSLVLVLALAAAAPGAAVAQSGGGSNPFGPLPPPQQAPPEAPEPQRIEADEGNDDGLGGTSFWLIIGTTASVFALIAFLIMRDMRRTVGARGKQGRSKRRLRGTGRPAADAASALTGDGRHHPGSHKARAKAQKRAKTKAARRQRRKSRSR